MYGAFRLRSRVASSLDRAATGRPIVGFSPVLAVQVRSEGDTATFSTSVSSTLSQTSNPFSASSSLSSPSFPVAAIAAIIIGTAFLVFGVICLVFAFRRRAAKRGRRARMFTHPKGYQSVAAIRPDTPPSGASSPSTLSSLSTRALVDLEFYEENDNSQYGYPKTQLPQARAPAPRDRRSVDTIFALRFYYSHIPGLPAIPLPTPPRSPTRAPAPERTTPPAPASHTTPSPKHNPARQKGRTYLNPAGEPWVSVPPPNAPLPPPPRPTPASSPAPAPRPKTNSQTHSHIPDPRRHHTRNGNHPAQPPKRNHSRPAPIKVLPPPSPPPPNNPPSSPNPATAGPFPTPPASAPMCGANRPSSDPFPVPAPGPGPGPRPKEHRCLSTPRPASSPAADVRLVVGGVGGPMLFLVPAAPPERCGAGAGAGAGGARRWGAGLPWGGWWSPGCRGDGPRRTGRAGRSLWQGGDGRL
ncbi:hypothetical protein BT67DRAFT_127408 [Trichocladium antarcticum]|uniref:Uncharacterized protein n=1 Tax=Trichocladium antarcticum TaxID=1450529 RepID=A0AAN6US69_9PEZI|nr:hypothetical protein BT67DRAFT_127408 [Trichocladium antarcticum]